MIHPGRSIIRNPDPYTDKEKSPERSAIHDGKFSYVSDSIIQVPLDFHGFASGSEPPEHDASIINAYCSGMQRRTGEKWHRGTDLLAPSHIDHSGIPDGTSGAWMEMTPYNTTACGMAISCGPPVFQM
jgi:hypothetical protein